MGGLQGQRAEVREWGDEWDLDTCCEIHEESIKKSKKNPVVYFMWTTSISLRVKQIQ